MAARALQTTDNAGGDVRARIEPARMEGMLRSIEGMPEAHYVRSTYDYLEGQMAGVDECTVCLDEAELRCSRCKTVAYCGKSCQAKDWKSGHKIRCFPCTY
jgi:hypothetical protein